MSRTRLGMLALLIAVPLLIGASLLAFGGDEPVSDDGPPPPPGSTSPTGTVTGTVTTPAGEPVRQASVQVTALDEPAPAIPEIGVLTGDAGRYEWRLPPGRYDITVRTGDRHSGPQTATVTADQVTRLDFTLP
ncbi:MULTISPECIES: carboxypeptidase-like regulatory domain-containing protein [unclassified Micromonospora]|uniref:carboxypeptidase-like regulatory domain-containing protein n=1 Tax=unclassified Micromonospora TaxID=2617518 RepID=UPI0022B619B0|nr:MULTISPECIES: carboxypeptidase-like regulatory domain-containing protein [unclassified Micromonospora]MCZ7420750.1 carboxypeptidase-like regulatory domain-containing protein [Verrucosispora sp. WMMA2121]WBB88790.1 carboxypeptidase-like regulatory domain-containing protein [Verrucosispora sp. WMMC514]